MGPHNPPVPADPADEDLLAIIQRDSASEAGERAVTQLLDRYRDRVYSWCWRHVRDREQAQDLAQEVLLAAYRNLHTFGERAQFSSWLFAIARNRCLSELRKRQLPQEDMEILALVADTRPTPDQELIEQLDESHLLAVISSHLTPLEQDALWLRCHEQLPVEEITRLLDIQEQTGARAVLQRARRRLRTALAGQPDAATGRRPRTGDEA